MIINFFSKALGAGVGSKGTKKDKALKPDKLKKSVSTTAKIVGSKEV